MKDGFAGNIAKAFIQSKLTILLMIAFLLIGGYSTFLIPREEEPQIQVPMADIFIGYPGASPKDVETKVAAPIEKMISNIKGVEYVYSTSMQGQAMVIVQFNVGEDVERSLVKLYSELLKNMDKMPQGVTLPLIKTRAIDDVPVLGLTLWSDKYDDYQLKQMGQELANEIKKINDVSDVNIIGGRNREVKVLLDKSKMAESHVDFLSLSKQIQGSNMQLPGGTLLQKDTAFSVETGNFLTSSDDVGNLVVGINQQQPVYLKQIAKVDEGAETPNQYVLFGYGKADTKNVQAFKSNYPAVTLSVAKKKGADAMKLSEQILGKVEHLKASLLPDDVHLTVTRNYGESASDKVGELLLHLFIAIVVVTVFVMLAMGWRGGLVVFLSVPVTFALTLFAYYFMHYTLNRITLFALVFITGIVVDDSIIVAENMHRHFKMKKLPPLQAAIYAINEVGNPTILATFTVIAAVLPMAFVSGMMGPYMSPMPIGASIAMILSLIVALTLTPYLGYIFLREKEKHGIADEESKPKLLEETRIYKIYRSFIRPLLETRWKRWAFILSIVVILFASLSMFYTKAVAVKMLPFDNKNEFQVVVDMPEGTTLEKTQAVAKDIGSYVSRQVLVRNYETYIGTSAPISFNGLVRHYDLRRGDNVADIQVNLVDKNDRSIQSHDIAKEMRGPIQEIAKKYNANVKIVEVPPGPPVLSTLVAEIYGPDYKEQIKVARQVTTLMNKTSNVVDVDWMVEDDQPEYHIEVNKEKAMRYGIATAQIAATVNAGLSGMPVGNTAQPAAYNQTAIKLQLSDADKSNIDDVLNLKVIGLQGNAVPVKDLVTVTRQTKPKSIYRKNQKEVVYVLGDMAGDLESPSYAISDVSDHLKSVTVPKGFSLKEEYTHQPELEDNYSLKWDGEWQITFEVFRDLGIAFAVVIIMIYILIVGWFQNFTVPLVMLAAIPLSLIGIVLGHWMLHAYFTATSMIGFIALAGVMVRNSILLIDFINIRLDEGIPLKQAIIEAGAVRTTPILLTAGAVALGAVIILFDPIFQGLAISLMGGTITSTFLTLIVVPLLYFKMMRKTHLNPKKSAS
ncbi:efflux RND transporter permease subunit [Mucilaginibacter gossypii]|uniref:efflux RND transporter permease subunit n=1 Tax=Mucilaginibacter gossypii TaxID=551996 RepID=UPI000DCD3558|nr:MULTISPECIES: efflux RND transporter permease subunit [Mucilaginibacter]QTE36477.1 efflux RND transporter permease subunit [Mucilaginibacter gossypii]RAV48637.1 AcrB/AcrD/AcrF family protein [Mucilaginibacter rubeus]